MTTNAPAFTSVPMPLVAVNDAAGKPVNAYDVKAQPVLGATADLGPVAVIRVERRSGRLVVMDVDGEVYARKAASVKIVRQFGRMTSAFSPTADKIVAAHLAARR